MCHPRFYGEKAYKPGCLEKCSVYYISTEPFLEDTFFLFFRRALSWLPRVFGYGILSHEERCLTGGAIPDTLTAVIHGMGTSLC